jgi:archaellum biogenesis protein FlaJ (TadC family)
MRHTYIIKLIALGKLVYSDPNLYTKLAKNMDLETANKILIDETTSWIDNLVLITFGVFVGIGGSLLWTM